ncbi:MAG TPA: protein-methionine-sulfoxide reductase catalytic subunit MsrP [Pseudomonadales bacterium]
MLIRKPDDIPSYEITPESVYLRRRELLRAGLALPAVLAAGGVLGKESRSGERSYEGIPGEEVTPEEIVTSYNNFYEFGFDKDDPKRYAGRMTIDPWSVEVTGECNKPGTYAYEDVIRGFTAEDRVYRLRCVEAWSVVVPWRGVPLADILGRFEPNGNAKFVEFTTLHRPEEMPGQRSLFSGIDWPYVEGLRMDEAMHPLTLMATGIYGKDLPNQNGAPWRLVVPWKYGFKSIKSVVKIRFTRRQPKNTWNLTAPHEYGFYANVNPEVDHPRWSQATERRLPSTLFDANRRKTLMFNGYADQVASLYAGMDLRRHF